MNYRVLAGLISTAAMMTGCFNNNGSSSLVSSNEPEALSTEVYQGLLLDDSGIPYWVVGLAADNGLILGALQNADDELMGTFSIDRRTGEEPGNWHPSEGLTEPLQVSLDGLGETQWRSRFSALSLTGEWQLNQQHGYTVAGLEAGTYQLLVENEPWQLVLDSNSVFTLTGKACALDGHWRSQETDGGELLTLSPESTDACPQFGDVHGIHGYQVTDALEDTALAYLIWHTERSNSASFLIP